MIHGIISVIGQAASSADGGISITGLTVGGAALTTIGGLVGAWLRARHGRTEITPQPLEVHASPALATKAENDRDHFNIFSRLSEHDKDIAAIKASAVSTGKQLDRIENKLDTILGVKG